MCIISQYLLSHSLTLNDVTLQLLCCLDVLHIVVKSIEIKATSIFIVALSEHETEGLLQSFRSRL